MVYLSPQTTINNECLYKPLCMVDVCVCMYVFQPAYNEEIYMYANLLHLKFNIMTHAQIQKIKYYKIYIIHQT